MTREKNSDDLFVSPEQSMQVYNAMQRGLSRREAMKVLGAAGALCIHERYPGSSVGGDDHRLCPRLHVL